MGGGCIDHHWGGCCRDDDDEIILPARLSCLLSLPLNERRNRGTSQVAGKTGLSYPDAETLEQETGRVTQSWDLSN